MPDQKTQLITAIDQSVRDHAMLSHPFYVKWTSGELELGTLREYARQYFAFERAFPQFLSAVHSRIDAPEARRRVLENLMDEEASDPNHQELWLRFCDALGLDRAGVTDADLLPSTRDLLERFDTAARRDPAAGLAALYAYESQAPAVAVSKLDGLDRHYGISDGPGTEFFEAHRTVDEWHAESERLLIDELSDDPAATRAAADDAARALWDFLSGVQAAYC